MTTMNPRANELVEHVNRVIKSALWRFAAECLEGKWWEVLGDVARSLRVLPTRALGYAPYVHVFKAPAPLAIHNEVIQTTEPVSLEMAEEDLGATIGYWDEFFTALRQRQLAYDRKMAQEYLKRSDLARYDVRFIFKAGNLVLLR